MKDPLKYILEKYSLNPNGKMPIEIPNIGRYALAGLFNELGYKRGAEIGVQSGEYSEILCKSIPGLELYCVDPWKSYKGYRDFVKQDRIDGFLREAHERLDRFNQDGNGNRVHFVQKFSMEAARDFEDRSLDFVYVDAAHDLKNVTNDIVEWSKKVRRFGAISGHDYCVRTRPTDQHVVYAVDAYTKAYDIRPYFVLGAKSKDPGVTRDFSRSWLWINP